MSMTKRSWAKKAGMALTTTALAAGITVAAAGAASADGYWEWQIANVVYDPYLCENQANLINHNTGWYTDCVDQQNGEYYVYVYMYFEYPTFWA